MAWSDTPVTHTSVDTTFVVGRPAFVATFYIEAGLAAKASAAFDAWLAMLPAKTPTFYGHANSRRMAKLGTPKALAKVREGLSLPSIQTTYQWYVAKSGPAEGVAEECHAYSFEIFVANAYPGYVYMTFPLDHVEAVGVDAVVAWFGGFCEQFGVTHAGAGPGFEVAWFNEQAQGVYAPLLAIGLRFHGVRVWQRDNARYRVSSEKTLDTAAWLTFLSADAIGRLDPGAVERIDPGVTRHPCGTGVVLQAGKVPDPCDVNRPGPAGALLAAVNAAIVPIRTVKWWVNGFAADRDKENRWFGRMDP